jgi:hypothetical protein
MKACSGVVTMNPAPDVAARLMRRRTLSWLTPSLPLSLFFLLSPDAFVYGQTNLVYVASVGTSAARPMAISGRYLYSGNPLHIFDLSNPASPVDVGYNDPGNCIDVAVSGRYAYLIGSTDFRILDVTSPTNPVTVGHLSTLPVGTAGVTVAGHYAYLTTSGNGGQSAICDVSDPTNPVIVGHLPVASSAAVLDNYAYLATVYPNDEGLGVYDISSPTNPMNVAFVSTFLDTPTKVVILGNCVYVAAYGFGNQSFSIFDISTRTNPVSVSRNSSWSYDLVAAGNYVYLVGVPLEVFDVSNPTNASLVTYVLLTDNGDDGGSIAVSHNYAYIALAFAQAISVWWLGSPSPPPLEIGPAGNAVTLSWPAPSGAFALQQNTDLSTTNWMTLSFNPVTVGSRNQVTVPRSPGTMFYRLVSQ